MVDQTTRKAIVNALGQQPTLRLTKDFEVDVDGDPLTAFESLTQSTPGLVARSAAAGAPEWTSQSPISVHYTIVNQQEAEDTDNALFVFAVLLGVAGAALIGSLQSAIHVLLERKHGKEQ